MSLFGKVSSEISIIISQVYQISHLMGINARYCLCMRRRMRIKNLFIYFLMCVSLSATIDVFDQKMSRAKYGDLSAADRVDAYQDVLRAIHRGFASEAQISEFAQATLGLLKQRKIENVQCLRSLLELVKAILASKVPSMVEYKSIFTHWKDVLERDLRRFALAPGETVRIRFVDEQDKKFNVLMKDNFAIIENSQSDGLSGYFKLALQNVSELDQSEKLVEGGDLIDLCPLYFQCSGISCAFQNPHVVSFSSNIKSVKPEMSICPHGFNKKYMPLGIMKKEKNPLYVGEPISLSSSACGSWAAVFERVPQEEMIKLENENMQNALSRIKMMSILSEKIGWLSALSANLNARIYEKNYVLFFKQLSTIFAGRTSFDKESLIAARELLFVCKEKPAFKDYKRYFVEWLKDINRRLESFALKYSDSLKMFLSNNVNMTASILPRLVHDGDDLLKEFHVGAGTRQPFAPGYDLISLIPISGKSDIIFYGDEVEISFKHLNDIAEVRCFSLGKKDTEGSLLAGSTLGDAEVDSDSIFVISSIGKQSKGMVSGPLASGDSCVFRSKKTGKVLVVNSDKAHEVWAPLEFVDESQASASSLAFSLMSVSSIVVDSLASQSFLSKLSVIKLERNMGTKIDLLFKLVDSLSPKISNEEHNDFWDSVMLLASDKKHMSLGEMKDLLNLLRKIALISRANGITSWELRANQLIIDIEFYNKVKQIMSSPGMDKFKQMLELVPEIKKISQQETQVFLEELALLRKYKKDQSKAAKLLFLHVSDEVGSDLQLAKSGNISVR